MESARSKAEWLVGGRAHGLTLSPDLGTAAPSLTHNVDRAARGTTRSAAAPVTRHTHARTRTHAHSLCGVGVHHRDLHALLVLVLVVVDEDEDLDR